MTPPLRRPKTTLGEELRLIHPAGWALAALFLFSWLSWIVPAIIHSARHKPGGPQMMVLQSLMIFVGLLLTAYILLIFYVNADAKRRQMSRVLWTLLVIFIPNGIGFIIYFILRQPIALPCPKCNLPVPSEFAYCPNCGETLTQTCPACHRAVESGWKSCAYCGGKLTTG